MITLKDLEQLEKSAIANKDSEGTLYVGAAIGANKEYLERSKKLIDAGCNVLVVDVANGHSTVCTDAVQKLKE